MKSFIVSALFALGSLAWAEEFKTMSADELQAGLTKKEKIEVFDANTPAVRKKFGVITGSKNIEHSTKYDTSILPKDKSTKVVFYCYNEMCTASHSAAKRAIELGYKNAYVMIDGITGWANKKYPISH